ncbi:ABC transporter ATP-binding protein [Anaerorhabdus sp.]|uniref:ABC transporter ATP-binding protein n=1 Tax=Anaerorhabdus sp. TaxID=1872524 RepID=UPI002FC80AB4
MKNNYGFISNLIFSYRKLYQLQRKQIIFQIIEIIFAVLTPIIAVLIPSLIVNSLQNGITINDMVLLCFFIFIGYGFVSAINSYVSKRNFFRYISYRQLIFVEYQEKAITVPLSDWESESFKQAYYAGTHALNSNSRGVEDFHIKFTALISSIIGFIIYCGIASSLNGWIVVILIVLTLFHFSFFNKAVKDDNKITEEIISSIYKQWEYFIKIKCDTKAAKDIRIYELGNWLLGKHHQASKKLYEGNKRIKLNYFRYEFIGIIIQFIRDILCYGYLIIQLKNGLDPSLFVLYIGIIIGISKWVSDIATISGNLYADSSYMNNMRYILDYKTTENQFGENISSVDSISIEFKNVSFSYPESDRLILDNVSFKINHGEKVALVGINGAGKSTIVKLICGFYTPTSGIILINDMPLNDLNQKEYLKYCSCVFQDSLIMSTPICENIACVPSNKIDYTRLERVVNEAGLSDKINSLVDGYHTYIGTEINENGINLSGGEIQKVILARALYHHNALFLLDEPTAALDAIAENKVYALYDETIKYATSLFISHRLSSTKFCDKILVLSNSKITESGNHDELINLNGLYAKMFKIQSQYYEEGCETNEIQTNLI